MGWNPIVWVQTRLAGGPRTLAYLALGYVGVLIVFTSITYSLIDKSAVGRADTIWLMIVSGAQALFLLLLAPSSIHRAVQRDFQTGMIESHRITPMSSLRVMLGYLVGPAASPLVLFGVGLLAGGYFSTRNIVNLNSGAPLTASLLVGGWATSQGLLLILAAMLCGISVLSAIAVQGGKFNIMGLIVAAGFLGGWSVVIAVPGAALLSGVMGGSVLLSTIFKGSAIAAGPAVLTAALLQAAFTVLFLFAAARKFRAPDRALFPLDLSFVLLAMWGVTLVLGMALQTPSPWMRNAFDRLYAVQIGSSLLAFMLVAIFTNAAAAADRLRLDRAAVFDRRLARGAALRSAAPVVTGLAAMGLTALLIAVADREMFGAHLRVCIREPMAWTAVSIAVLLSCWVDYNLCYIGRAYNAKPWLVVLVAWGLLKVAPPIADGALREIMGEIYGEPWSGYGFLTAVSPVGTLLGAFPPTAELIVGLVVQILIAAVIAIIARDAQRRLARRVTRTATADASQADRSASPVRS
ncbi:MAG: hypothetical protein D6744_06710 [Planctomycetota bacterium]|nr:MAG: hypothetical protein D6744_06710 [Planctomycetota bacterium]